MRDHNKKEIKAAVKERYAALAKGAGACCPPDSMDSSTSAIPGIYVETDIAAMPAQVLLASAGCGNPTALAQLKFGEVVLDLGSGGGIDCFLAAVAVGPEGRVVGIDMTIEMVDLAWSNARKMSAANVEFHLGDMEKLPFGSGTIDVVISNCVVCLSPDKAAVFEESFRVLKSEGRLYVSDMVLIRDLPANVDDDPDLWAECVTGAEEQNTYIKRLVDAGFSDVTLMGDQPCNNESDMENLHSICVQAIKPRVQK